MDEKELSSAAGSRMILQTPLPTLTPTVLPAPADATAINLPGQPDTPQVLPGLLEDAFVFLASCPRLENESIPWSGIVVQGWTNASVVNLPPEVVTVNTTSNSRLFTYKPRISLGFGPSPKPPTTSVRGFPRGPIVAAGNCSSVQSEGWVQVGDKPLVGPNAHILTANDVVKVDFVWIGGIANGRENKTIHFTIRRNDIITLTCNVPQRPFPDSGYVMASARGDLELLVNSDHEPHGFEVCSSRIFGGGNAKNGRYTLWDFNLIRRGYEIGSASQTLVTGISQQDLFGDSPIFSFEAQASTNYLVRYRESCEVRCVGFLGKTARVEIASEPELII